MWSSAPCPSSKPGGSGYFVWQLTWYLSSMAACMSSCSATGIAFTFTDARKPPYTAYEYAIIKLKFLSERFSFIYQNYKKRCHIPMVSTLRNCCRNQLVEDMLGVVWKSTPEIRVVVVDVTPMWPLNKNNGTSQIFLNSLLLCINYIGVCVLYFTFMLLCKGSDSGSGSCLPFNLDTSTVQVIAVCSYIAG